MPDTKPLSEQELASVRKIFALGGDTLTEFECRKVVVGLLATIDERERTISQQRRALRAVREATDRIEYGKGNAVLRWIAALRAKPQRVEVTDAMVEAHCKTNYEAFHPNDTWEEKAAAFPDYAKGEREHARFLIEAALRAADGEQAVRGESSGGPTDAG